MSRLSKFILPNLIIALMVLTFPLSAFATTELSYDDGIAETGLDADVGIEHAVRFSLQSGWSSAKILVARFFIWNKPDIFRLHIYGSGVTDPALDVSPVGTGWFDVDLSSYNIVVSGDFYISIEYVVPYAPAIGMDNTGPIDLRSYAREPPGFLWEVSGSTDLMIRAVVDPIGFAAVGGVVVPTNKLEILTPYLALAGLVIAISTVIMVKRRRD